MWVVAIGSRGDVIDYYDIYVDSIDSDDVAFLADKMCAIPAIKCVIDGLMIDIEKYWQFDFQPGAVYIVDMILDHYFDDIIRCAPRWEFNVMESNFA